MLEVAEAQARGDARAVLARPPPAPRQPACAAATSAFVAQLQRPGDVEILQYRRRVQLPLTRVDRDRPRRLARRTRRPPVVQCVRVRRDGPLTGREASSCSRSRAPIGREAGCPREDRNFRRRLC